MTKPIKVLIVEDYENDAKLALRALRRGGFDPTHGRVQTAAELETALAQEGWDAVISDFSMPGFTGMDALRIFCSTGLNIPFILISGTIGEETAVNAMKAGASDYVMKNSLARLAPALERELIEAQTRAAHHRDREALIASESRFRQMAENIRDVFFLRDVDTDRMLYISPAYEEIWGRSCESLYANPESWSEAIHPDDRASTYEKYKKGMLAGKFEIEYRIVRPDGSIRWIEARGFPVRDDAGKIVRIAGVSEDITERKWAETRIKYLNRVYAMLSGTNTLIVRVHDRDELFSEACRIAVEEGGFRMALIAIVDRSAMKIVPVAWTGKDDKLLTAIKSILSSSEDAPNTMVARAIREKKTLVSNDSQSDPRVLFGKQYTEAGVRSMVILPLVVSDEALGVLAPYASESEFFHEDEMKLLTELAGDISFALENIDKEEKIARLSRIQAVMSNINSTIVRVRDRQELFNETCRIAVEHGGFGIAWVGTFNPDSSKITPVAWNGLQSESFIQPPSVLWTKALNAESMVSRAILEKHALFNNDITVEAEKEGSLRQEAIRRGYRSLIVLPLLVHGSVMGNLSIFAQGVNFFTEDEVKLLTDLTGDISFALEHIDREEQLHYLAYYDELTGLPNRTLFLDRMNQHLHARGSEPRMVAMILLDLERFRTVNESLGRKGGDELLRQVAQRLEHACQGKESLARVSANGYGVIMRGARDATDIAHAVEGQLLACFREPYTINGTELRLAVKAGIALFPTDGNDTDMLFRNAEAALKKAKTSGDRYLFYATKMNERAADALSLETRLRKAVEVQQFVLHYQPKIELASGRICGLEALIRWNDPENGLIPPVHFIPLLEETGLIIEVGQWALAQALADYRDWVARGYDAPRIAVNVSSVQVRQKDFVDMVSNVIGDMKAMPHGLDIEITESLIMENIEANIAKFKDLRDMGLNISIDDFGTGYSSLGYLARLPVNTLKIDRSFIMAMTGDADSMTIVSTVISLGHSLNMKVIAEGVETEEQSRFLKLLKCDQAQGYLFSKPLPKAQIEPLLQKV